MNLATRHSCVKIQGWGPLYPAGSEDMGGSRAGPNADGLGQMEMYENGGGGWHRTSEAHSPTSGKVHSWSLSIYCFSCDFVTERCSSVAFTHFFFFGPIMTLASVNLTGSLQGKYK